MIITDIPGPLTMRGVQLDEPSTPISQHWKRDIEYVRKFDSPKLEFTRYSNDFRLENKERMRLPSRDLVRDMREKCSVSYDKGKDKSSSNFIRKIMQDRKSSSGRLNSCDIEEDVELSFESTTSSSGLKDGKVTFSCDSSPETSDLDLTSERTSTDSKSSCTKKDKESKKRRFKRMITRPLRRSKSAGCAHDIPAHALFVGSDNDKKRDTIEARAVDLTLLQQRLRCDELEGEEREPRKIHKTCSADAAMMASQDFTLDGSQGKTKRNSGFKNMKKKFQFLRRRHTDTSLVPKFCLPHHFSIPTYDQALQWSKSFESLLGDKNGLELFKGFLKSEFSEENLEFWIACEEFRYTKDNNISIQAQKIYGDYVAFQAPKEVNLDSATRMTTVSNLENPSNETFLVAQHKIQALMEKDSYSRFIESELFQQILESLSKS